MENMKAAETSVPLLSLYLTFFIYIFSVLCKLHTQVNVIRGSTITASAEGQGKTRSILHNHKKCGKTLFMLP
jgi:hypothetical protein